MHINDAIDAAIPNVGIANHINDKLLRYYLANGAVSLALDDAEREFLIARGEAPAHINDMWFHYLRVTKAFAGSLDDMHYVYWTAGPRP
jgi:hypothetical protein